MTRLAALTAATVALLLALTGCGGDPHGSIVELSYTPAHRANVSVAGYILVCLTAGSTVVCNPQYTGSHLEERAFEAQWNATLTHCGTDSQCHSDVVGITKNQYESWSIGDYYPSVLTSPGMRSVGR